MHNSDNKTSKNADKESSRTSSGFGATAYREDAIKRQERTYAETSGTQIQQRNTAIELLVPAGPDIEEEALLDEAQMRCQRHIDDHLSYAIEVLIKGKKWEELPLLLKGCLLSNQYSKTSSLYTEEALVREGERAIEQAKRAGEYDIVVSLLSILINCNAENSDRLKLQRTKFIKIIQYLLSGKPVPRALLEPEMKIIDGILDSNPKIIGEVIKEYGFSANDVVELMTAVTDALENINSSHDQSFMEMEQDSALSRFLFLYLLAGCKKRKYIRIKSPFKNNRKI